MYRLRLLILLCLLGLGSLVNGQDQRVNSYKGASSFGIGLGLPYGALGIRGSTYLANGFSIFGGIGYHLVGVGYNFGILADFPSSHAFQFYLTAMYGTNGAIWIRGGSDENRVYAGPSFGMGMKINASGGNYFDLGLLVPIRSSEFMDAYDRIDNSPFYEDVSSPWPVLIVLGYNFNMN
ncbi:MAG: hypothetical protein AAGA85_23170 [Bacteroidota bacterium]